MARQLVALVLVLVTLVAGVSAQTVDSPASSPEASAPAADSVSISPSSSESPDASSPVAADVEPSSPPAPASEANAPSAAPTQSPISAAPEASAPNAAADSPVAAGPGGVSSAASDDYY